MSMKKFVSLIFAFVLAAAFAGPMIPKYAHAEKYEQVAGTTTTAISTWTVLTNSTQKFSAFRVYEKSGLLDMYILGSGTTLNGYAISIPKGTQYSNDIYKGTTGVYVCTTATGISAIVDFESKRPASYWPWR
jgi:hypothetical protein